ncbi:MAG: hypothetical protein KKD44_04205 [Proteobacteria bacterium]|nr:hypothetical protein [Pseudomonadota bacterium]
MGKSISKKDSEEREQAYKSLPPSLRNSLTDEEKDLFLHADVWPDTLFEKLSEFIIQGDEK